MVLLKPAKTFTNNKFPLGRLSGDLTCGAPTLTQPNWELKVSFSQSQALWREKHSWKKIIWGQKRLQPGCKLQDGNQDYLNYLLQSSLKSQTWKKAKNQLHHCQSFHQRGRHLTH